MSRKRFEDIMKLIHFADNNNLPAGDKLAKIRPLQDGVNALLQFGVFAKGLQLMNKWYHTLVGTLQRCSFVASRSDLATKNGF